MEGVKTMESRYSVRESEARIIRAIADEGWHVFAQIDHAAQAHKKGLELRPTRVVLFGNPRIGTLLIQEKQEVAIDLPMKILIWEDTQGRVQVGYNTVKWLSGRHGIANKGALETIGEVVARVASSVN